MFTPKYVVTSQYRPSNNLFILANAEAQLLVESYPSDLFNREEDIITLMEGTTLWLYCRVNAVNDSVDIKWTKDKKEMVKDLPHVYTTSSSSKSHTIAIVVVDGIDLDDRGMYLCSVKDGKRKYKGDKLTIRGMNDHNIPQVYL